MDSAEEILPEMIVSPRTAQIGGFQWVRLTSNFPSTLDILPWNHGLLKSKFKGTDTKIPCL